MSVKGISIYVAATSFAAIQLMNHALAVFAGV